MALQVLLELRRFHFAGGNETKPSRQGDGGILGIEEEERDDHFQLFDLPRGRPARWQLSRDCRRGRADQGKDRREQVYGESSMPLSC